MALNYNSGTSKRFNVTNSAFDNLFAGGGTWMAWIKRELGAGGLGFIVDKVPINWRYRQPSANKDRVFFTHGFSTTDGEWFTPFPASVPQDVFHHLALTYDSDSVANDPIFYVNGVDEGIEEGQTPVGTASADTGLASCGGTGGIGNAAQILFEDLRFYNRLLPAEEILTIVNARGVDGIVHGLVARWVQDELGVGDTAPTTSGFIKDASGFKADGTQQVTGTAYVAGVIRSRRKVS